MITACMCVKDASLFNGCYYCLCVCVCASVQEADRLNEALKKEEFRKLLQEYAEEISDPENRKVLQACEFTCVIGWEVTVQVIAAW